MTDNSKKICLITGGTSGIGAAAATELARQGYIVIITGRSAARCKRQARKIRSVVPEANVEFIPADLSSGNDVLRLAAEFQARYQRLDVLINNAGAFFARRELSSEGLEMSFALNHLGGFRLTNMLLASLRNSSSARIVNVASHAHTIGKIDFDDLQTAAGYTGMKAYSQSKLANVLFTYALARRLGDSAVTVNALDPGNVATNLGSNNNWLRAKARNILKRTLLKPEEGAKTVVYLASSKEVEGTSGRYFHECRQKESSASSHDENAAERLWEVSEQLAKV